VSARRNRARKKRREREERFLCGTDQFNAALKQIAMLLFCRFLRERVIPARVANLEYAFSHDFGSDGAVHSAVWAYNPRFPIEKGFFIDETLPAEIP